LTDADSFRGHADGIGHAFAVARGVSYKRGERVRYTAAPVFDLIIETGEVDVV
jgi:hypothetical protein